MSKVGSVNAATHIPPCCTMEHSVAVEDYLKAVYNLGARGALCTTGAIARRLEVSAPSVSSMVARLVDAGLVRREGGSVRLTEHGQRHAQAVVRRHRLLETFLHRVLDVPWEELHAEAEVLEHAVSERLADRIDARLGHPTSDPHGDPIPPRSGAFTDDWPGPLRGAATGVRFVVQRVSDRDSAALRHLGELGIRPGVPLRVGCQDEFGGPLWVHLLDRSGRPIALGAQLVDLVFGKEAR